MSEERRRRDWGGFNEGVIEEFRTHHGEITTGPFTGRSLLLNPDWYRNLRTNPRVTVEVGPERFEANARVAKGAERRRLYDLQASRMPGFKEYEKRTSREIPVIVLERAG